MRPIFFFSSTDKELKQVIRSQGRAMCHRGDFDQAIEKFDYGFVVLEKRPGARLRVENRFILHGFILTEAISQHEVRIRLMCANKRAEYCPLLFEYVIQYAQENGYCRVTREIAPKLLDGHREYGFTVKDEIYKNGVLEVLLVSLAI